uniref:Uncharacterized protein n=1 Tax=Rhizophora mucronata TaxID=61149 RepID=A0A2P2N9J7_RHIMU
MEWRFNCLESSGILLRGVKIWSVSFPFSSTLLSYGESTSHALYLFK